MISIVVAEVDESYLRTICSLLELEEDAVVIGQADSLESAGSILEKDPPDIFIADISWLYAQDFIKDVASKGIKMIILSTFADPGNERMVMESGAHGYLIKDSTGDELIGAIRTVMTGEHVYSPKLEEPGEESSVRPLPVRKAGPIASIVNRFKSSAV
ncbi:hypothetical protein QU593_16680 [Rossellomorea marisflavi]|uniref:response regulator n=1 Tax=Rossellomorea marisflavi TaxID=189381 RepID=UPI0025AFE121|nr:response regulator [Rossellomorea marisflavi]WJV17764.1 hypothetical protein QU593_16680 [Rossellomorea marisflavi]